MQFVERPGISAFQMPATLGHPVSLKDLEQRLSRFLPDASVGVSYEWYPNTADVLIASSSFETRDLLNQWTIRLIAVDNAVIESLREALLSEAMKRLSDWFIESDRLLQEDPAQWVCYCMTVRWQNNCLIYDASSARREAVRPEPGWPHHPN